jgi:hypothetical protein
VEIVGFGLLILFAALTLQQMLDARRLRREAFIRSHPLPQGLFDLLRKRHPTLDLKSCQLVAQGLRQFFLAHLMSGRRYVSMPSQAADDLWHEFILFTRDYETFCRTAFGRFLHHTPAVAVTGGSTARAGLRRCWWFVCRLDNIDPRAPTRLPLLFALDEKLEIVDGFRYVLDCGTGDPILRRPGDAVVVHCGTELSSPGPFGDSNDGCGGGDDGGCGGGGCGGD